MNDDIKMVRREFRRSEEARYIHRLHGVLLVLRGLSAVEAGRLLGDPQRTVAYWAKRFKEQGLNGLRDGVKPGRPASVTGTQAKGLNAALKNSPRDLGLDADNWTGLLVAKFLRKRYGIKLTMRHCRRLLRNSEQM